MSDWQSQPLLEHMRNPALQHALRTTLERDARESDDPLRKEIAEEVLSGRTTMFKAAMSSAYAEVFERATDGVIEWWQDRTEEEREEELRVMWAETKDRYLESRTFGGDQS